MSCASWVNSHPPCWLQTTAGLKPDTQHRQHGQRQQYGIEQRAGGHFRGEGHWLGRRRVRLRGLQQCAGVHLDRRIGLDPAHAARHEQLAHRGVRQRGIRCRLGKLGLQRGGRVDRRRRQLDTAHPARDGQLVGAGLGVAFFPRMIALQRGNANVEQIAGDSVPALLSVSRMRADYLASIPLVYDRAAAADAEQGKALESRMNAIHQKLVQEIKDYTERTTDEAEKQALHEVKLNLGAFITRLRQINELAAQSNEMAMMMVHSLQ